MTTCPCGRLASHGAWVWTPADPVTAGDLAALPVRLRVCRECYETVPLVDLVRGEEMREEER